MEGSRKPAACYGPVEPWRMGSANKCSMITLRWSKEEKKVERYPKAGSVCHPLCYIFREGGRDPIFFLRLPACGAQPAQTIGYETCGYHDDRELASTSCYCSSSIDNLESRDVSLAMTSFSTTRILKGLTKSVVSLWCAGSLIQEQWIWWG